MNEGRRRTKGEPLHRVTATFTASELDAIDSWGFDRRIRDRSAVLRKLVEKGMSGAQPAASDEQRHAS